MGRYGLMEAFAVEESVAFGRCNTSGLSNRSQKCKQARGAKAAARSSVIGTHARPAPAEKQGSTYERSRPKRDQAALQGERLQDGEQRKRCAVPYPALPPVGPEHSQSNALRKVYMPLKPLSH
jgi:hypothetical protein